MASSVRPLRIGLLTSDAASHFCRSFISEAEASGHEIIPLFINGFQHDPQGQRPLTYYGKTPPDFDALVPRIAPSLTADGVEIIKKFEMLGVVCLASSAAIAACRDQSTFYNSMQATGIPTPKTIITTPGLAPARLIESAGGPPLVIKLSETGRGEGAILAHTFEHAEALIRDLRKLGASFVLQKFIAAAGASDIRCLVLAGRLLAAIERRAKPGDFRANLHQGATAHPVTLPKQIRLMSILAAERMGLNFAGVDIMRTEETVYLLEVNASPGIKGFENASQGEFVRDIIKHLVDRLFSPRQQTV